MSTSNARRVRPAPRADDTARRPRPIELWSLGGALFAVLLLAAGLLAPSTGATPQPQVTSLSADHALPGPAPAAASDPECDDGKDNDGDGKIDFPADPGCRSALDTSENDLTGTLPCPEPGFTFEGFKGTLEEPAGSEIIRHVLVMNGQVVVDRFEGVDPDFPNGTAQFTTTCSAGTQVLVTASWTVEGTKVNYTFDVKHQSGPGSDSIAKTIAAETRGGGEPTRSPASPRRPSPSSTA